MTRKSSFFTRFAAMLALLACLAIGAWSQSIVSGDITGTVSDPSGAVIPGAKVTIKNNDTGQNQEGTTNGAGVYRFALLKPGRYTVVVTQAGFGSVNQGAFVAVGQVTRADVKLAMGSQSQTVEVTAETPLLQSDNGNTQTSFNTAQIDSLPTPGGDITAIAESAPGIAVNTSSGGGYGNFTSNGTPGNANLFTVNGNDEMDPYLNLNNSGASNLSLGANELAEATVTTNGYTGEYGRNAGAQINYATKSGTNHFHGNAIYDWSGAVLNARDWFVSGPAPNTHDHQWAGSVGGPIWKDKTFFFVDTEGLKYTLPTSNKVFIPSPALEAGIINNLNGTGQQAAVPFYQQMFNLYNNAPGAAGAVPSASTQCIPNAPVQADPTTTTPGLLLPGFTPNAAGDNCVNTFRSSVTNGAHEWILVGRVDHQFTAADRVFFRYKTDHGVQPTFTDPISSIFNATSIQPSYEGQANWSHTFSNAQVNQLILSGSYYSALFTATNQKAALAAYPYSGPQPQVGPFTSLGGENYAFPQGRNVSQYQIVDDYSINRGNHNLKFGVNYRHNNVTDFVYSVRSVTPEATISSAPAFANGNFSKYQQRFSPRNSEPFVIYSLGLYVQDQWKITPRLSVTLALRGDRNSNPSCTKNCYSTAPTDFENLNHSIATPYNQALQNGQGNAFRRFEAVAWQPRFGFAYTPYPNGNTVLRGGIGFFADIAPGTLAELFSRNIPQQNSFTIRNRKASPTDPKSAQNTAIAANSALVGVYSSGGTVNDLTTAEVAAGVATPVLPNLNISTPRVTNPKYLKYNLELQQGFGSRTTVSFNYNGNHGRDIIIENSGLNAFCPVDVCGGAVNGIPLTPADSRFGTVSEYTNSGVSDYNGVTVSLQRRYTSLQLAASYTWSHSTDDVSNGGLLPYSNNDSIISQINPHCLSCQNHGNSDYDIRHYLQANYTWTPGYKFNHGFLDTAFGGWTLGNTFYLRSGLPFSVYDSGLSTTIANYGIGNVGSLLLNKPVQGNLSCGRATPTNQTCFLATDFGATVNGLGGADPAVGVASNSRRNQNRGPSYFDTDLSISKTFKIAETFRLGVGANAFNVLNHPNFANPGNDFGSGGFGSLTSTVSPPTSPFGAFAGASSSGRVMQVNARITF